MAKTLATLFGAVLVLAGVLGLFPNPFIGRGGLFETDTAHTLVHLISGIILLAVALRARGKPALWLKILGAAYIILAVLGFGTVPDGGALLGVLHVNHADHWLHIFLGVLLVIAGSASGKGMKRKDLPPSTPISGSSM